MNDSPQGHPNTRPFPTLAHPSPGWGGLPVTLEPLPARDTVDDVYLPHALVGLVCIGTGKRWLKSGVPTQAFYTAPGMVQLMQAGTQVDHARWDGTAGQVIVVELPEVMVNRLLQDDARHVGLRTHHELFDAPLAQLVTALWSEAANGSPLGALYAQGVTLALLGLLGARYGAAPDTSRRRTGKFGPRDAQRLRNLIAEQLSADLRIERLAELVSMSPHHFARTFKATFDQSPHAFVLERRIEAACRTLRSDIHRPIADIASASGFANQAHFTEAFRRRMGTTPARWRAAG